MSEVGTKRDVKQDWERSGIEHGSSARPREFIVTTL